jgi:chromate transporter
MMIEGKTVNQATTTNQAATMKVHAPDPAPASGDAAAAPALAFGEALRFWLKLGFISFGGPAGQIAVMHRELVERRRWISEHRFLHALNYCMLLPGPEAQQLATYIGWLLHRTPGALVAGGLFVLPSLLILIALSWIYMRFGTLPVVAGVLWAVKPAVVAIVLHAAWRLGRRTLRRPAPIGVALAAFAAIFTLDAPFPLIVAAAAALGYAATRFAPGAFALAAAARSTDGAHAPTLIDDATPLPAHARFSRARLLRVALVSLALWAGVLAALTATFGWDGVLTQMGWFFTKAALLTFGGAYAVLPYVVQGAVEHYQWLSLPQMMDGLALGETTPGPLIMIVAFVGFVGGWQQALFGPDAPALAGIVAAVVVSWSTFLPSFFFILAGAPFIESTRHLPQLAAPLAAITAAVVGVIVNLALFFAAHVLLPQGTGGGVDWAAAAIGVVAVVALFRFELGVIPLIAACAAIGLARALLF